MASPLIWAFSSLGVFIEHARSPREFSDLTENILVPQTTAFSIWFPIFLGILAYGIIQASRANSAREIYRKIGWWMTSGLWGIAAWGLITAYVAEKYVELSASLIFIPTMICLVVAMTILWRDRKGLSTIETWLVLCPISLIAGWCSLAVFVGLNGLIWNLVQPLGWHITGTALSIFGIALWWAIYVLRQQAMNKAYAAPILWGLGFLVLRHFGENGNNWIGAAALIGIFAIILACFIRGRVKSHIL